MEKLEARSPFDVSETRSRQLPVAAIGNRLYRRLVTGLGFHAWCHSSFCGWPIRDTPTPSRGQPALLRTSLELFAVLQMAPFSAVWPAGPKLPSQGRYSQFGVSSCERCGFGNSRYSRLGGLGGLRYETRSEPGRQVAQTRFLTGFDRVCPGLPGFDRVNLGGSGPRTRLAQKLGRDKLARQAMTNRVSKMGRNSR
jgi:hypothetical protein